MSQTEETQEAFEIEDDALLQDAILEYADSMEEAGKAAFTDKINKNKDFRQEISYGMMEMATLISAAAMLKEDSEFTRVRRRALFESRKDNEDLYTLRCHYLSRRDAPEIQALISSPEQKDRFEKRLSEFFSDYKQQHSFRQHG